MTFLNPFVLFGLAAAAVPIVLHLLNLRKLRTIEFSTLTFLKELQRSTMRKVKIRQWLLLLLRTLLVILIVCAFSRPALRGTLAGIGSHAKTTIVIILDDSYSMSLHNERGSYLKQAQSTALHLIDMLKEGDDALLIRLSDLPQATIQEPTHDLQKLRDEIRRTEVSYKHRTAEDAVRLSSRLLQQSKNFNKEVYLLTDDQRSTCLNQNAAHDAPRSEKLFDSNTKLFVVPFSDTPFENIGIEKVEIPPALFQKNKPLTVRADVRNYGSMRVQNYLVNLYLDGARVMQKSISLNGGERTSVDLIAVPSRTGFVSGHVGLEEDAFEADNENYFSLKVPDRVDVLLSSSDPKSSAYIRLALTLLNQEGAATPLVLTELAPQLLTSAALAHVHVVILSNVASLSPSQADQLVRFSSQGGGILFFAGNVMNIDQYNVSLLPKLGLPSLLPVQRQAAASSSFSSFEKIDFDHPVFQGMFEQSGVKRGQQKNIESPNVYSSMRFSSEREIRSVISLSNGVPFLWEKISGSSRLLGFSVAANTEWSDFPLKGIFVPLLYQTILYAASEVNVLASSPSAAVGEHIGIPLSKIRSKKNSAQEVSTRTLRILDPNGRASAVQPYSIQSAANGPSTVISFEGSSQPGIYSIVQSNDTLGQIPVNIDPAESNGERTPHDLFVEMAKRYGLENGAVSFIKDPGSIDTVVLQSRYGVELWKYFLFAAIVVGLTEMAVAREPQQTPA